MNVHARRPKQASPERSCATPRTFMPFRDLTRRFDL
jgi:hypothetical protein